VQTEVAEETKPAAPVADPEPADNPVITMLRNDIALSKTKRDDLVDGWQKNVDERRGKNADTDADEGRSMVPIDWTVTKTKSAQLFSQMPAVRLTPKHKTYAEAVPVFAKVVNDLATHAKVEAVMTESLADCINAAGIGAAIVRYEALSEMVDAPAVDKATLPPEAQEAIRLGRMKIPTVKVNRVTSRRFCVDRISPADLLWPKGFRRSDWDKAPWLGHTCRDPWAKAKRLLGLKDEDKDKILGANRKKNGETLSNRSDAERKAEEDYVEYDEVFYYRYLYHEDEKYYDAIQRVVFVCGMEEPVINEPWKGQRFNEQTGSYVGSCVLPIRVLTLAYISDEAIPPSDSAIIRPLVKELQESRQHMKEQRKQSRPLRWFDVDKVDPTMVRDLVNGTWQGMIPTIGNGDKALGEVARSSYPRENHEFDEIYKRDIQEAVSVGPNQSGQYASGERSASEAQIVQASFQTEIGFQRAKVAAYFVGIMEVLAGLWCLYGVIEPTGIGAAIGPEGAERLETWDRQAINQKFVFDVRADSTVRLDAQQLLAQLTSVLNVTAQSGFINPKPLIKRIVELNGLDPAEVLIDPTPKGPEPPKISYNFKGEDLANPIVLAIINKSGQGPSPEDIEAAKAQHEAIFEPPTGGGPTGGGPAGAPASDGFPLPEGSQPEVDGMPTPSGDVVTDPVVPERAFKDWESAPRVNTRRAEG
jgi:hypothetical protein